MFLRDFRAIIHFVLHFEKKKLIYFVPNSYSFEKIARITPQNTKTVGGYFVQIYKT